MQPALEHFVYSSVCLWCSISKYLKVDSKCAAIYSPSAVELFITNRCYRSRPCVWHHDAILRNIMIFSMFIEKLYIRNVSMALMKSIIDNQIDQIPSPATQKN